MGTWGDLIEYYEGNWCHVARGNSLALPALGNETETAMNEEVTSPAKKKAACVDGLDLSDIYGLDTSAAAAKPAGREKRGAAGRTKKGAGGK